MIIFIVIFVKVKMIMYGDFQHHLRHGTPKCSQWPTPASRWLKTTIYQPWKITCKLDQYLTSNDMTLMCWNMWQNPWNMWQTYFYVTLKTFDNIWHPTTWKYLTTYDIWHQYENIWKHIKTYENICHLTFSAVLVGASQGQWSCPGLKITSEIRLWMSTILYYTSENYRVIYLNHLNIDIITITKIVNWS